MAAIIFPPNPAGQTPVNTFSTTSTPLANTANTFTYTWNGTAWTSAPAGGGGGGTVTGVLGSAPIVSSGGTNPTISATLATAPQAAAGTSSFTLMTPQFAVPKDTSGMAGAALLPSGGNYAGTTTGMFRFNTTSNHVEFYDGTARQTSVNRSGDTMTGGLYFGTVGAAAGNGDSWSGTGSGNVQGGVIGFQAGAYLTMSRGGSAPIGLNRTDGIGSFIDFYDANGFAGFIGKNTVNWFCYQIDTSPLMIQSTGNEVYIQGNNAGGPVTFRDGGGNAIAFVNNAGAFITISDENIKVDVEPLTYGLSEVIQLEPKSYKLVYQVEDDHGDAPTQLGFLAQQVEPIVPEVVDYRTDEKGNTTCSIAYSELIPVLVNAIKELKAEFDEYKASHP